MAQFCECGSLLIHDKCTNKHCNLKKSTPTKGTKRTDVKSTKSTTKASGKSTRRSSKVVTYNLADMQTNEKESE